MTLLYGTVLICLAVLFFTVVLVAGRNPAPSLWVNDWLVADVHIPVMLLLALFGFFLLSRFAIDSGSTAAFRAIEMAGSAGVVLLTVLTIRQMKVGRRLKQYAEMEADMATEETASAERGETIPLYRKLPWQVRLHLAETMGFDPNWIRTLRCVVREMDSRPDHGEFRAFSPAQAREQGVAIHGYETLEAHPELVVFSGSFATNSQKVTVHSSAPRRAA